MRASIRSRTALCVASLGHRRPGATSPSHVSDRTDDARPEAAAAPRHRLELLGGELGGVLHEVRQYDKRVELGVLLDELDLERGRHRLADDLADRRVRV